MLLTLSFILAMLIVLPYKPNSVHDDLKPIDNMQRLISVSEHASIPINDYSTFTTHPLFSPKRSPYVKAITTQSPQSIKKTTLVVPKISTPLPSLIGLLTVNNIAKAFVLGEGDIELTSLQVGDDYKNWTLTTIETDHIKMTYNENGLEEVISLDWAKMKMLNEYFESDHERVSHNLEIIGGPTNAGLMNLKDRLAIQVQDNK